MPLSNIFKISAWKQFFLYLKAANMVDKEKYNEAKILLKNMLKKGAYVTEAHYYVLGKIYFFQKDYNTAEKCFLTSIENNCYHNIHKANTYCYLAHTYYEMKQYEKAIYNFKLAIELKERLKLFRDSVMNLPHLYCYLGRAYVELNNPEEAFKIFNKGLEYEPNNKALQRELTRLGI